MSITFEYKRQAWKTRGERTFSQTRYLFDFFDCALLKKQNNDLRHQQLAVTWCSQTSVAFRKFTQVHIQENVDFLCLIIP